MRFWVGIAALLCPGGMALAQTQENARDFDASVASPAFAGRGPIVTIDEAHLNFHTAGDRYEPFARLLRNDGFRVVRGTAPFTRESLAATRVLIIANAGSSHGTPTDRLAFAETEADAVRDWVRAGGALLLIADHTPFGRAAENLAARFGVAMGNGWVFEPGNRPGAMTTQIVSSRENGRLGVHPIMEGRNPAERIRILRAFTGQSLTLPPGAIALMRLGPDAREAPDATAREAAAAAIAADPRNFTAAAEPHSASVAGRVQGLAMRVGRGRVVILAEAAMLSAQIVTFPVDGRQVRILAGMNFPGIDNRQFALNVMHWLTGLLDP